MSSMSARRAHAACPRAPRCRSAPAVRVRSSSFHEFVLPVRIAVRHPAVISAPRRAPRGAPPPRARRARAARAPACRPRTFALVSARFSRSRARTQPTRVRGAPRARARAQPVHFAVRYARDCGARARARRAFSVLQHARRRSGGARFAAHARRRARAPCRAAPFPDSFRAQFVPFAHGCGHTAHVRRSTFASFDVR